MHCFNESTMPPNPRNNFITQQVMNLVILISFLHLRQAGESGTGVNICIQCLVYLEIIMLILTIGEKRDLKKGNISTHFPSYSTLVSGNREGNSSLSELNYIYTKYKLHFMFALNGVLHRFYFSYYMNKCQPSFQKSYCLTADIFEYK